MATNIFILGAGASAASKAPLMGNFFRAIEDVYEETQTGKNKELEPYLEDFRLVIDGFYELDKVNVKVKMGYSDNIEEIFATFEMARILGRLGDFSKEQISRLPSSMAKAIALTIEQKMHFRKSNEGILPPDGYSQFSTILELLSNAKMDFAIITFNYDVGIDFTLANKGLNFTYCLDKSNVSKGIPLLKLHGSLNWGVCSKCKKIGVSPIKFWTKSNVVKMRDLIQTESQDEVGLRITSKLNDIDCGCSISNRDNRTVESFIVPPTWNKTNYYEKIQPVWNRAAIELSNARNIYIIGYSFGETDQFFKHLLALGLSGGPQIDKVRYINIDIKPYQRLSRLMGDYVSNNTKEKITSFEDSQEYLRKEFNI